MQCHVTLMKRVNREMLRFLDRHPMLVSAILGLTLLAGIAWGVWRLAL